jgi:GR25 family glycosyltransferase involved in LPS biosynthesis
MILILIPLLSLLYRRTKAVRITSPQNFSSHHHWGVNQVDQPLEIALFLHHTEASHLLSASNSDTLISCCCHWSTGSQCIKSESNSLRTYLEKEGNIEFQLYLPWARLIRAKSQPKRISIQVVLTNDASQVTVQSASITLQYHGTITAQHVLQSPSYIINMQRKTDRWRTTSRRLHDAGFTNILRWNAIDGSMTTTAQMEKDFNIMWGSSNHRACSASHTALWTRLLQLWSSSTIHTLPSVVTIFEDDALPHENFSVLFPTYLAHVPTDADVVYVGWQRGAIQSGNKVYVDPPTEPEMPYVLKRHPACLHAYIVTRSALEKMLKLTLPLHDTIDGKLMRLAWKGQLQSYAFNGMKHVSAMLTTNLLGNKKSQENKREAAGSVSESESDIEEDNNDMNNMLLQFDGETEMSTAELVVSGAENCPSRVCPRLVVSRMDRSRGIIFQDATMGTDIDSTAFVDDDAASMSRYAKHRTSVLT